jgi:hypothetical protein
MGRTQLRAFPAGSGRPRSSPPHRLTAAELVHGALRVAVAPQVDPVHRDTSANPIHERFAVYHEMPHAPLRLSPQTSGTAPLILESHTLVSSGDRCLTMYGALERNAAIVISYSLRRGE